MLFKKELILEAFKNVAEKGLVDKDVLMVKLEDFYAKNQETVTLAEVQPIVDILQPPAGETPGP